MFFGVFDFTFVGWIFVGAFGVLVYFGLKTWFEDLNIPMNWWKWVLTAVWYIGVMMGIAAPFTFMGEGEVGAGWKMLLFTIPLIIVTGVAVYRILLIGKEKETI